MGMGEGWFVGQAQAVTALLADMPVKRPTAFVIMV
jgi:hypothetical protein